MQGRPAVPARRLQVALDSDDPRTDDDDSGASLLRQISGEMVALQKQYWGKGPRHVKSYILNDLVLIVMRGGLTVAERTMVELGQQDLVRQFRQVFENNITDERSAVIARLAKREVLVAQGQIMFDPDVVIEIFVLDDSPGAMERFAAAELIIDE
jgi:uncharacterized protein YbcI